MLFNTNETLDKIKQYAKSAVGPVIIINIILSFVAVARDMALASYLGTTVQADALLLAFFVPDMIGAGLLSVSIIASCVPVYSKVYVRDKQLLSWYTTYTTLFITLFSIVVYLVGLVFSKSMIGYLGNGFTNETRMLCLDLFRIILPIIMLWSFAAAGNSLLQAHQFFKLSAFVPVVNNSVYLLTVLIIPFLHIPVNEGVYTISHFIVVAAFCMSILTWGGLIRNKIKAFQFPTIRGFLDNRIGISEGLRQVLHTFIPYILMLFFAQGVLFNERYLATHLGVGAVAGLNYAYRLAQFPIWVFVAAVGMVILPSMSRSTGLGKIKEFKATFTNAFWLILIISLPLSIILHILRVPIVSILLQRGAFDNNSLLITSGILAGYSLAVVGLAAEYICHRVCLAMGKMVLPLITTIITTMISITVNFLLIKKLGLSGLGYGLAVGVTLNAGILVLILKKILGFSFKNSYGKLIRVLGANLAVLIIALICNSIWSVWPQDSGFLLRLLYAVFVVVFTGMGYIGSLRYFKII